MREDPLSQQGSPSFTGWSEPDGAFHGPRDTAAGYAKVVINAYNAVHAANPSAKEGMTVGNANVKYIEQAIQDGADNVKIAFFPVYENTGGYTKGTWYYIPCNVKWYTVSIPITDAQFDSGNAFNFALCGLGYREKFYIKSVSVTRNVPLRRPPG